MVAVAVAAAFSVHAQYSQYSGGYSGGSYGSGGSCDSGDGSRRSDTLQVVGLTEDQRLICFNERNPGDARNIGFVSGLMSGDMLVGIDFRVQNKKLYGVSKTGGVYILDTGNASAIKVSQLTVSLEGTSFGVDFNRLQIDCAWLVTPARTCAITSTTWVLPWWTIRLTTLLQPR